MKERTEFYNGYLYRIEKVYHNTYYTKKTVFHIKTNNPTWAGSLLPKVIGDDSITVGEYRLLNDRRPSIENSLKKHHSVKFIENAEDKIFGGYYEYTIIEPYDD